MLIPSLTETPRPAWMLPATPAHARQACPIPLFCEAVRAGFPSPAADYAEGLLDLNAYLIHDEPGTFMVRVASDSMQERGILPGDVLVVDRGLNAVDGDIVVAELDGEFTLRELRREYGQIVLFAHHQAYAPIRLAPGQELIVFGVVTAVVRKFGQARR
jgi:DNA polymerase V